MDILVKHAVVKTGDQKTAPSTPTSFNKPCRYGSNCTRHSCRFMHPGQTPTGKIIFVCLTFHTSLIKYNNTAIKTV